VRQSSDDEFISSGSRVLGWFILPLLALAAVVIVLLLV